MKHIGRSFNMRVRYRNLEIPPPFQKPGPQQKTNEKGLTLMSGPSEVFYLSHSWQAELVFAGRRVHVLDCAIRFNAFLLAEEAFRRGESAEATLNRVSVQRAYTPYQILDATRELLESITLAPEHAPVPFILAPAKQFFDGDVAADEARFLLGRLLSLFGEFKERGFPLVVIEKESYKNRNFPPFIERLVTISSCAWRLEQSGERNRAYRFRKEEIKTRRRAVELT